MPENNIEKGSLYHLNNPIVVKNLDNEKVIALNGKLFGRGSKFFIEYDKNFQVKFLVIKFPETDGYVTNYNGDTFSQYE